MPTVDSDLSRGRDSQIELWSDNHDQFVCLSRVLLYTHRGTCFSRVKQSRPVPDKIVDSLHSICHVGTWSD